MLHIRITVLALLATIPIATACSQGNANEPEAVVKMHDFGETTTAVGEMILPTIEVEHPENDGVRGVYSERGALVYAGQLLVRYRNETLNDRYGQAIDEALIRKDELDAAKGRLQDASGFHASDLAGVVPIIGPVIAIKAHKGRIRTAQAQVNAAHERWERAVDEMDRARIAHAEAVSLRSPCDCEVLEINADPQIAPRAGEVAVRLARPGKSYVDLRVSESQVVRVVNGDSVDVKLPERGDLALTGTVDWVSREPVNEFGEYSVEVRFQDHNPAAHEFGLRMVYRLLHGEFSLDNLTTGELHEAAGYLLGWLAIDDGVAVDDICDDDLLARMRPGVEHAVTLGASAASVRGLLRRDLECVGLSVPFDIDYGTINDILDSRSGLVAAAEVIIRSMREQHWLKRKTDLDAALALLAALDGPLDARLVPGVRLAVHQLVGSAHPDQDTEVPDLAQSVVSGLREALDESIHLPAGTTVNATIRLGPSLIGLAVPAEAVVNGGEVGVGGVYRVHPDGKRYLPLELLGQESGGYVHVRGELSPGDHVLLNPRPGD